jgi:hypothetical protein
MNAREAGIDPSQDVILFSVVTLVQGAVRCTQFLLIALSAGLVCCGCSTSRHTAPAAWPKYTLTNAQSWRVNLPSGERMDASGLCFTSHGELLTVSDRLLEVYRIDAPSDAANAELTPLSDGIASSRRAGFAVTSPARFDIEGIACDSSGRIYLCEEQTRGILRFDRDTRTLEKLSIDWSPVANYFSSADSNASFEAIAIGDRQLFVANERQQGRIIVVDLHTLRVVDDFLVHSSVNSLWGPQYSDLCWFQNDLYVLMREDHVILRVNPRTHEVLAEYDFRNIELAPENEYQRTYWFTGVMEGLAVEDREFWLIADNNGLGRKADPRDIRPTLFRCPRPDRN